MASVSPEGERSRPPPPPLEGGTGGGGGGGGGGGEVKPKRKMKTPSQIELLEKTYAVETYPSESLRAELSVKLGLTDRQLQMWFCHRRLKDRKAPVNQGGGGGKRQKKDVGVSGGGGVDDMMMGIEHGNEPGSGSGSGSSQFEPRKIVSRVTPPVVIPRMIGADVPMVKRYYESPQSISEARAIEFVEAQLGERVREDGPILGMEFDPLPPGAFGAPIDTPVQQNQAGRSYDGRMYERHDPKLMKTPPILPSVDFIPGSSSGKRKSSAGSAQLVHPQGASRSLHEYQFLPEKPSIRHDAYERLEPSRPYGSAADAPSGRASSVSVGPSYHHGKEQVAAAYGLQGQVPSVTHLSQQGRQCNVYSSVSGEYDSVPHRNSLVNIGMDAHPAVGPENSFLSPDRRVSHEDDVSRMERKRKMQSEEARIAREVEAHEKRIRKELEKQDILRRKREEQMRREMEKHDRERRKDEEKLMRERQREEERFQREQRRELERREKFLQKETLRAEKMRQKEELRREREEARAKAANERATARRIAKESMELIEDERLELMDLAVAKKGLSSILSLDTDTVENLDLFRDMLSAFPPKSLQLKKPFAIQPWSDSEENVANLLMVWRFLITFADVLDLWPFTLEEFVQALHDYDPRLLGEIHVAILRSIIKDIEDVARTPMGLGANQNSAANPGGGHPQIVEGAYAWGFDIRSWQRHLNPLTWPEILRQFALSAGFGPKLKKRSLERAYFRDENEGHDGEDIISTLRNGAAAENAVAVMQEKGYSHPRRSRHRLTPGTVKFAAFHILSLEGSKGLTILEVAEKIQKSGLRDLTTSKTPEASIAAALSRDGNLFERTAPSTYCVKPAFRKDPTDAEAILSAARSKIQVFQNGFSDSEGEKEADEVDDVERDDDSECDVAEEPEIDDVGTSGLNSTKEVCPSSEGKASQSIACSGNGKTVTPFNETPRSGLVNVEKGFSSFNSEGSKEVNPSGPTINQPNDVAGSSIKSINLEQDTEIDESHSGEPWLQGLTEGEYCGLTVEERLNALVALIGVAIEGNSIRVILEERLEAANALKKQMWAEAQLDKRRMKEEYGPKLQYASYTGIKAEPNVPSSAVENNQSPLVVDSKNNDPFANSSVKQESKLDPQNGQNPLNNFSTERNLAGQEFTPGPDNLPQQHAVAAERSRSQLKSYIGHKAEEMYVYRSLPLGQDRRRNRYWQFVTSASRNDPGSGMIFFESQNGYWRLLDSEEAFDALLASLDTRGVRESHLQSMLHKIEMRFREAVRRRSLKDIGSVEPSGVPAKPEAVEMSTSPHGSAGTDSSSGASCVVSCDSQDQSSSFRIELHKTETEKNNALKRYEDFQIWMWKECLDPSLFCAVKLGKKRSMELLRTCDLCHDTYFFEDDHCPVCHKTFRTFCTESFSDHVNHCEEKQIHGSKSSVPLRTRLLKSQLALIEACVPPEALEPLWTEDHRKSWGMRLQASLSAEELLQVLTLFESAIKHDCISSSFETTKELLAATTPGCAIDNSCFDLSGSSVSVLPWVPETTAAVALRLMELDASISYVLDEKVESHKDKEAAEFIKLPSRYTVKNIQEMEQPEALDQGDYLQEENWIDIGIGASNSSRGRGGSRVRGRGRNRGGRLQRAGSRSRSRASRMNIGSIEKISPGQGRKSQARGRGGRRRGRRSVRSRPKLNKKVVNKETDMGHFGLRYVPQQNCGTESPRSFGRMDWEREPRRMHIEDVDNSNSGEASDSDDHGQEAVDEYDERGQSYGGMFNGRAEDLSEESEEDGDEDSDDEDPVNGDGDDDGDGEEERDIGGGDAEEDEYPYGEDDADMYDGGMDRLVNENEDENVDEDDDEDVIREEEEDATSSDYSD